VGGAKGARGLSREIRAANIITKIVEKVGQIEGVSALGGTANPLIVFQKKHVSATHPNADVYRHRNKTRKGGLWLHRLLLNGDLGAKTLRFGPKERLIKIEWKPWELKERAIRAGRRHGRYGGRSAPKNLMKYYRKHDGIIPEKTADNLPIKRSMQRSHKKDK